MKRFRYLDKMHPLQELSGSFSYILCFTILISLYHNISLWEVIFYQYRFLSTKVYQNKRKTELVQGSQVLHPGWRILEFWVQRPGSWVLCPGSWVLCLGSRVSGPGSWFPGPGSWVLDPHFRLCLNLLKSQCRTKYFNLSSKFPQKGQLYF